MRRTTTNFVVDLISFVDLLLLAATGTILKWVLPPGSGGGQGRGFAAGRQAGEIKTLLDLGRHDWGDIHFVLALLFIALMLVHLFRHWTWIKTCTRSILLASHGANCGPDDDADLP